ncbi:unnamed protein product [Arabis nemorensis]|uniref:Knottin scorpion toxin-like domain-containing protein n=1 Tax=Arabis nemorensis TaxID=586526 RepID=A0A565CEW5_9BRAS|nr:unnamed protein product [Arabis nemorensis]
MGSLRLSKIVVVALVVCLSILLLSPTEVEGLICDVATSPCKDYSRTSDAFCKDICVMESDMFTDGVCRSSGGDGLYCMCCRDRHGIRASKETMRFQKI